MENWSLTAIDREGWDRHWQTANHCTLPQSWEYGTAMGRAHFCRPGRFVIHDGQGVVRGMVQFLVRDLPWLGGAIRLNRGPVVCGSSWSPEEQGHFLRALKTTARCHRWWYLRSAFAWPEGDPVRALLQGQGFRPATSGMAWGSHLLSLTPDVAVLRQHLAGKWRNLLVKGERLGVVVQAGVTAGRWQQLQTHYQDFQRERGFAGISPKLLDQLIQQQGPLWRIHLLSAHLPTDLSVPVGLLVAIHHGETATYLIGLTTGDGRRLQANYLLLWQAILLAKAEGLSWFDLGGVTAETPEGIRHFKSGLGGKPYQWVGEWVWHGWRG